MQEKDFANEIDAIYQEKIRSTLLERHKQYGEGNLRIHGEEGIVVRLGDKLSRLQNELKNSYREDYSIDQRKEVWTDIAGYAIQALRLCDELHRKNHSPQERPKDDATDAILSWPVTTNPYGVFPFIKEHLDENGSYNEDKSHDGSTIIRISTGGSNRNAYLIMALALNTLLWGATWKSTACGGHYTFSIPKKYSQGTKDAT